MVFQIFTLAVQYIEGPNIPTNINSTLSLRSCWPPRIMCCADDKKCPPTTRTESQVKLPGNVLARVLGRTEGIWRDFLSITVR
jgi:hypothetical protein